jgi:hypothetical protein
VRILFGSVGQLIASVVVLNLQTLLQMMSLVLPHDLTQNVSSLPFRGAKVLASRPHFSGLSPGKLVLGKPYAGPQFLGVSKLSFGITRPDVLFGQLILFIGNIGTYVRVHLLGL